MLRLLAPETLIIFWLLIEVGIPFFRDKPKFLMSKWVLRKLVAPVFKKTTVETIAESARRREKEAQIRLEAAIHDRKAAELEECAAKLEDETNEKRGGFLT